MHFACQICCGSKKPENMGFRRGPIALMKRPDWPACSKKPQPCPSQGCRVVGAHFQLQSQPRDSQGPSALAYPLKQNSNRSQNPRVVAGGGGISRLAEREGDQHVADPQPHPHRPKKIQVPFGQIQIGFLAGVGVEDDVGLLSPASGSNQSTNL